MVGLLDSYRNSAPRAQNLRNLAETTGSPRQTVSLGRRARQLRDDELDQLVTQYDEGKTMVELARSFHIHRTTVAERLASRGVAVRETAMTERHIDEAVRLYESGLSFMKVGAQLGFNASTITTHLKRRGVAIRGPHERT